MDPVAELRRDGGEHTAELATAEDADRRTGWSKQISPRAQGWERRCSSALRASRLSFSASAGIVVREQRGSEQGGIGRARLADREGRDGNAAGHLDDRIEAVDAVQGGRLDGDAKHRHARVIEATMPEQVRRAAGAGDDGLEVRVLRPLLA